MSPQRRRPKPFRIVARLSLALWLVASGCAKPKQQATRVVVRAESDPGVALGAVAIEHDGREIGASDEAGLLPLRLIGPIGDVVQLDVRCPAGYRVVTPELRVVLRPNEDAARLPAYRVQCRPERRSLVVAVRAQNGAGIPVRYLGNEIARTDADGIAHGLLELAPGEQVKLVLDTTGPKHRYLRPQNPALQISVPDRDEVVSVEQPFTINAPKPQPPKPIMLPVHF